MFRAPVTSTPFVGQYADVFFPNISGETYQGDVSFLSTMRALLAPKMKEEDSVSLHFMQSDPFKLSNIGDKKEYIKSNLDFIPADNSLIIYNLRGDADANSKMVEELRKEFPKLHKGFNEVPSVAEFYLNSFPCICFKNEKIRTVVYFVGRLNMRSMHYLQASIPVPFTWFIPEVTKDTFGDDGWALIKSLAAIEETDENGNIVKNGVDEYMQIIMRMSKVYDFEKARIKSMLGDFETRAQKREISNLQDKIGQIDSNIASYQQNIMQQIKQRDDTLVRIWGLQHKLETLEGESELLDYFVNSKSLYLERVEGDRIYFAVKTYLTYIDPSALDRILKNKQAEINRTGTPSLPSEDMCMLLRAALIDGKIKMRMCAAYSISLSGGVNAQSHHDYPAEFDSYIRNYHIDGAHCMGNYTVPITNALKSGNFVGAIENCIASAMSQNVLESATFYGLVRQLYDAHHKYRNCFELPDGSVVSPENAVKWLKEQEAMKNEQEKKPAKKPAKAKEKGEAAHE